MIKYRSGIESVYNEYLHGAHEDWMKVGWGSQRSQERRFQILCSAGKLDGLSILDFGCGTAALYAFLQDEGVEVGEYTGVDINQQMIDVCRERYPGVEFICEDVLCESSLVSRRMFDYVMVSGALNLTQNGHSEYVRLLLEHLFSLARKGLAVNFLSAYAPFYEEGEFYMNPAELLPFLFYLSKKVTLRHDYMPHDFTVMVYR